MKMFVDISIAVLVVVFMTMSFLLLRKSGWVDDK